MLGVEAGSLPLPTNWRACKTDTQQTYFFNELTGETRWTLPDELIQPTQQGRQERQKQRQQMFLMRQQSRKQRHQEQEMHAEPVFESQTRDTIQQDSSFPAPSIPVAGSFSAPQLQLADKVAAPAQKEEVVPDPESEQPFGEIDPPKPSAQEALKPARRMSMLDKAKLWQQQQEKRKQDEKERQRWEQERQEQERREQEWRDQERQEQERQEQERQEQERQEQAEERQDDQRRDLKEVNRYLDHLREGMWQREQQRQLLERQQQDQEREQEQWEREQWEREQELQARRAVSRVNVRKESKYGHKVWSPASPAPRGRGYGEFSQTQSPRSSGASSTGGSSKMSKLRQQQWQDQWQQLTPGMGAFLRRQEDGRRKREDERQLKESVWELRRDEGSPHQQRQQQPQPRWDSTVQVPRAERVLVNELHNKTTAHSHRPAPRTPLPIEHKLKLMRRNRGERHPAKAYSKRPGTGSTEALNSNASNQQHQQHPGGTLARQVAKRLQDEIDGENSPQQVPAAVGGAIRGIEAEMEAEKGVKTGVETGDPSTKNLMAARAKVETAVSAAEAQWQQHQHQLPEYSISIGQGHFFLYTEEEADEHEHQGEYR